MTDHEQGHTVSPEDGLRALVAAKPGIYKAFEGQGDSPASAVATAIVGYQNALSEIDRLRAAHEHGLRAERGESAADGEAWYDQEVAPVLAALAQRCLDRGMSFLACVEYQPGDRGATYSLAVDAGVEMRMLHLAMQTVPNIDRYLMSLRSHFERVGIDAWSSIAMKKLFDSDGPDE